MPFRALTLDFPTLAHLIFLPRPSHATAGQRLSFSS
jgi:hypothetical protein